jgi:hypothetical protein
MDNLQALREEIDNMVIEDKQKVRLAEQIIACIDHLSGLLDKFNNE